MTDGFGRVIAYTYDDNGNRTSLTDPDDRLTDYEYDADNRLTTVITDGGTTSYVYDGVGAVKQITHPNGTVATHQRDAAGRVASITHASGGTTLAAYTYTYDDNGNRLTQVETQGGVTEQTTYSYDVENKKDIHPKRESRGRFFRHPVSLRGLFRLGRGWRRPFLTVCGHSDARSTRASLGRTD